METDQQSRPVGDGVVVAKTNGTPGVGGPRPSDACRLDALVSGPRLLEMLWDPTSRPSLRWLREQQRRRRIPFVKVGARVWFKPSVVQAHLDRIWTCKAR